MPPTWQPPAFSTEPWYSDPRDYRCPQDATLDSVEIGEQASTDLNDSLRPAMVVKLLSTHSQGTILFSYFGVRRHSLTCYQCDQGAGTWLRDEFSRSDDDLTQHRIFWHTTTGENSQWIIEADQIALHWAGDLSHATDE